MITVGIDEVGRGCWAGPLVAGAVILGKPLAGLRDSKKLSRLQREKLSAIILQESAAYGLGWVSAGEIDRLGLTKAVRLAMVRALAAITANYDEIIIDGNINYLEENHMVNPMVKTMVHADDLVPAVSAASIIAKVARDNFMHEVTAKYPEYGFDKHVGYGTAAHLAALKLFGVCELHRCSYKPIRDIMELAA